jgi:hypothetical protein
MLTTQCRAITGIKSTSAMPFKEQCAIAGQKSRARHIEIAAHSLDHPRIAKDDGYRELELSTFAVTQLAKMLRDFKGRYHTRWHGELTGAS